LILSFFPLLHQAQEGLVGYYQEEFLQIAESDRLIHFRKDGSFTYEEWDDVGDYFGMGYYHIKRDSLFLHFQQIGKQAEAVKIVAQENQDTVSSILIHNTYFRDELCPFTYRILQGDSLIERGKSDLLGSASFQLKDDQLIDVVAYPSNSKSILQHPVHFKVEATPKNQDYVILLNVFPKNTELIQAIVKAYPIKGYRNGKRFLIKEYYGWQKFKRVE